MVNISHKDKNGKRQYMHSEYEYSSNQYNDRKFLSSIKLSFDSFLLIEDMDKDWNCNRGVKITQLHMHRFKKFLKKIINWFEDDSYNDLYYYEDKELRLNKDFSNLKETLILGLDNIIMMSPAVIFTDDVYYEGVLLLLNNNECGGYMTVDNLMALSDIVDSMNLYELGLIMLAYIRRPDFNAFSTNMSNTWNIANNKKPLSNNNNNNVEPIESSTKVNMPIKEKRSDLDEFFY